MSAPARISPPISKGWNDATLAHAYRPLERRYDAFPDDDPSDAPHAVFAAMEMIEAADCEIRS